MGQAQEFIAGKVFLQAVLARGRGYYEDAVSANC